MEPRPSFVRHTDVVQTTQKGFSLAQIDPVSDEDRPRLDHPWSRASSPSHGTSPAPGSGVMGTQPTDEIEELYRSQRQPMIRLARLLTRSPTTAEEIVQEAFIKFARSAGKKDEPAAYLRVIVVNLCRSQQRRTLIERRLAPKASPLSGVNEIDETWDVLRKLPFRQRSVLMLRYYEDLSEAEIARVLGCRPGTVKSSTAPRSRGSAQRAQRTRRGVRGETHRCLSTTTKMTASSRIACVEPSDGWPRRLRARPCRRVECLEPVPAQMPPAIQGCISTTHFPAQLARTNRRAGSSSRRWSSS